MVMDVISIGDVTEDVFVEVTPVASVHCRSKGECYLDLKFGTKLAIERVDKLIGGNAGNVAIGSRRLGLRSAIYSEVGDDTQGKRLLQSFLDDHVSVRYFRLKKREKTNYSVVLHYKGERTILVHHEQRHYCFPSLEKARYVYLTSMSQGSERIFLPLRRYLKKTGVQLGFNPGTHQLRLGLSYLKPLLRVTKILFVNVEEAQTLLRTQNKGLPFLLRELHHQGPKIVVISDGPQGSYTYDGKKLYYCPIYDVPVVERTGCGDSYATGFLSAIAYGKTVIEAMKWGTVNAASVIQQVGPQAGLIQQSLLQKILKANTLFQVRTFHEKEVTKNRLYKPAKYTSF